jgi:hypothetical protein
VSTLQPYLSILRTLLFAGALAAASTTTSSLSVSSFSSYTAVVPGGLGSAVSSTSSKTPERGFDAESYLGLHCRRDIEGEEGIKGYVSAPGAARLGGVVRVNDARGARGDGVDIGEAQSVGADDTAGMNGTLGAAGVHGSQSLQGAQAAHGVVTGAQDAEVPVDATSAACAKPLQTLRRRRLRVEASLDDTVAPQNVVTAVNSTEPARKCARALYVVDARDAQASDRRVDEPP